MHFVSAESGSTREQECAQLRKAIRGALHALEKGRQVAAFRILEEVLT